MADHEIVLFLNILLWIWLGYRFARAFMHRKINNGAALYMWSLVLFCYLAALLTVDEIESAIDEQVNGLPLSILIRTLIMLATAHLFYLGLRSLRLIDGRFGYFFPRINFGVALICILIFTAIAANFGLSHESGGYLIKTVRDVTIAAWVLLLCVPTGRHLLAIERLRPMKAHRLMNLLFFVALLLVSVAGVAHATAYLTGSSSEPVFSTFERFITYFVMVTLLTMLIPFRWLSVLFYPQRYLLLRRIRSLENRINEEIKSPLFSPRVTLSASLDDLELAIYQAVISILDNYQSLPDNAVKRQIVELMDTRPPFELLARQMASVRS